VLHLRTQLPGCELVGVYSHVWKFWWAHEAILGHGANPAFCPWVNYPRGLEVGYYTASFGHAVWTLPVTYVLGPVASFNAVVLLSTAAGFWAAALLGIRLGLSRTAAAFTGLAWGLAPHHMGYLMGGSVEHLANPWIPLFLLGILELTDPAGEEPRSTASTAARAALVAASLWLAAMVAWFTGAILALVGGLALIAALALRRGRGLRGVAWAGGGLAVGCLAVMASAHVLLPTPEEVGRLPFAFRGASLSTLLPAAARGMSVDEVLHGQKLWLNHQTFATVALLAAAGLATRGGRIAWLLALPFLVDVALGTAGIVATGAEVTEGSFQVPALIHVLLVDPERRLGPLQLLVALAAGAGLTWLCGLARRRAGGIGAALVVAAAVAAWTGEHLATGPVRLPVPRFTVPHSPHARALAGEGEGAVLDFPLLLDSGTCWPSHPTIKATRSRYVFEQTLHGHPILSSVGSRLSYAAESVPLEVPSLVGLEETAFGRGGRDAVSKPDLIELRQAGFHWIVVHRGDLPPGQRDMVIRAFRNALGEPLAVHDDVWTFEL